MPYDESCYQGMKQERIREAITQIEQVVMDMCNECAFKQIEKIVMDLCNE